MAFDHGREFVTRIQQWIAAVSMRKGDAGLRSSALHRRACSRPAAHFCLYEAVAKQARKHSGQSQVSRDRTGSRVSSPDRMTSPSVDAVEREIAHLLVPTNVAKRSF